MGAELSGDVSTIRKQPELRERPAVSLPLHRCLNCAGTKFSVEERPGGLVLFVCQLCEQRWRFELGYIWRVPK